MASANRVNNVTVSGSPKIGEVRRYLSFVGYHVYAKCEKCGKPRWTTCSKDGCVRSKVCWKCSLITRTSPAKRPLGAAAAHMVYCQYRLNAKRIDRVFSINEAQFLKITQKPCQYCGAKPVNVGKSQCDSGDFIYNGLDRSDNSKGYTANNIVPCCKKCNRAKSRMTSGEFIELCNQVIKYQRLTRRYKEL